MSSCCVYTGNPEMKNLFHYFHVRASEESLCIR